MEYERAGWWYYPYLVNWYFYPDECCDILVGTLASERGITAHMLEQQPHVARISVHKLLYIQVLVIQSPTPACS